MATIIVLDSSDEEPDKNEKSSTSTPTSSKLPKEISSSKRNKRESLLKLKKPEWYTFQNNRVHPEAASIKDVTEKPTPTATLNGKPLESVLIIEKSPEIQITQSNKPLEPLVGKIPIENPEASSSPGIRNCGTPTAECSTKPPSRSGTPLQNVLKRKLSDSSDHSSEKSIKRIRPVQVSEKVDHSWVASQSPVIAIDEDEKPPDGGNTDADSKSSTTPKPESAEEVEALPLNPVFAALLDACRAADPSPDMERIIKNKLLKYYHTVHPDFVASKGFCKTVKAVTAEIQTSPQLVYLNLKTIVEELQIRRKSKDTVMSNEEATTTGSEKKDRQVRRLSKALYIATKKIAKLEEADVDLCDDNSAYLKCERFKKRACEIYEMICDLTGESKHAHRLVKKPITFRGSTYPEFNRTLQSFVNRTNTFPDFFDVYRCLEHCNNRYCFGLKNDEMRRIAQDAFLKIGKSLQNRRKTDLYETVSHFTGCAVDPAEADSVLDAKLKENQKFHAKISSLIDRFAKEQEVAATESEKSKSKSQPSEEGNNLEDANNKKPDESGKSISEEEETGVTKNQVENNESLPKVTENGESSPKLDQTGDSPHTTASTSKTSDNTSATAGAVSLAPVEEIVISDGEDS